MRKVSMRKLSEFNDEVMLIFDGEYHEIVVMSKKDFMESDYLKLKPNVFIADEVSVKFDIEDYIEYRSDEMHEDWVENVMNDIDKNNEVVRNFAEYINKIFETNITYYEGEKIINDFLLEEAEDE